MQDINDWWINKNISFRRFTIMDELSSFCDLSITYRNYSLKNALHLRRYSGTAPMRWLRNGTYVCVLYGSIHISVYSKRNLISSSHFQIVLIFGSSPCHGLIIRVGGGLHDLPSRYIFLRFKEVLQASTGIWFERKQPSNWDCDFGPDMAVLHCPYKEACCSISRLLKGRREVSM
jgi:hypothetical protein